MVRRRLQRSNRWRGAKGYAPLESFFNPFPGSLTTTAAAPAEAPPPHPMRYHLASFPSRNNNNE